MLKIKKYNNFLNEDTNRNSNDKFTLNIIIKEIEEYKELIFLDVRCKQENSSPVPIKNYLKNHYSRLYIDTNSPREKNLYSEMSVSPWLWQKTNNSINNTYIITFKTCLPYLKLFLGDRGFEYKVENDNTFLTIQKNSYEKCQGEINRIMNIEHLLGPAIIKSIHKALDLNDGGLILSLLEIPPKTLRRGTSHLNRKTLDELSPYLTAKEFNLL